MKLLEYIDNPVNPKINFEMGQYYEKMGHVSPAISFYLRCADLTDDNDLRYECLLRMTVCFNKAGRRNYTCETTLKQAIALCPDRVEAYFMLAQYYEYNQNFIEAYTYASIGLRLLSDREIIEGIDYPGAYGLYFLKACSAWHIGKPDEARKTYRYILENFSEELTKKYKDVLQANLSKLGSGHARETLRTYKKNQHKLKHKFEGSDSIQENFAQVYQDICLLTLLDGKRNGTYLEIGSAGPFHGNNTALLEQFNWNGIGIEFDINFVNQYRSQRKNKVLHEDALDVDYLAVLKDISPNSQIIDYLQLDIEPSKNTFIAMLSIPFEEYKFRFITYEHDHYADVTKSYRQKSRNFLEFHGYKLLINDVATRGYSFEDWWYHPDLLEQDRVNLVKNVDLLKTHDMEEIFLSK